MEKVKQNIETQNVGNPSISGKYLYYIIIIYCIVSFLRAIGIGFTYIDYLAPGNVYEPSIHDLGNILFILTTISLFFFGVPLYNSGLSNTFLFRIIMNNYFLMIYYMGIVFYSILVKQKLTINRQV